MDAVFTRRLEAAADAAAAALYGAAACLIAYRFGAVAPYALVSGGIAGAWCFYGLSDLEPPQHRYNIKEFELQTWQPEQMPELLLSEADRVETMPEAGDELILDDVLPAVDADARVVRLFDSVAMPTPGELRDRIDRHLAGAQAQAADASEELYEALAELRRSIR